MTITVDWDAKPQLKQILLVLGTSTGDRLWYFMGALSKPSIYYNAQAEKEKDHIIYEPRHEKTKILPMRKQRCRSALQ